MQKVSVYFSFWSFQQISEQRMFSGWYPVGALVAGLYSDPPLNEVVAPPPGMATRLCFSVEYRHSTEQLTVSLLRLSNLPPRFHGNVTLVELRLLPDDRRSRQAKARGTGPDPEVNDFFIFQASSRARPKALKSVCERFFLQVSAARVARSSLSVCVLSRQQDGNRRAVGRVLVPMEGELGHAGRVLWRDLETEGDTQVHPEPGQNRVRTGSEPGQNLFRTRPEPVQNPL